MDLSASGCSRDRESGAAGLLVEGQLLQMSLEGSMRRDSRLGQPWTQEEAPLLLSYMKKERSGNMPISNPIACRKQDALLKKLGVRVVVVGK